MKKDTVVSSKIVRTNKKNENLEAPSNDVSKMLKEITLDEPLSKENKKLHRRLFSQVKLMPASQINYFIKSSLFEDPENASKLLCMFLTAFKSTVDFDIKTVIFKAYLESAYDKIGSNEIDSAIFDRIKQIHQKYVAEIDQNYSFVSCLLEKFSSITK